MNTLRPSSNEWVMLNAPNTSAATNQSMAITTRTCRGERSRFRCSASVGSRSSVIQRRLGRSRRSAQVMPRGTDMSRYPPARIRL